jgi:IclR family KDG regulon transcriptional repressor
MDQTNTANTSQAHSSDGGDDDPGGVQSIRRAFSLIEEIARNGQGIGLADLSKKVGLHNSTTFHLVRTLTALGCVRQISSTRQYGIGSRLFALAAGATQEIELVGKGNQVLEELALETGNNVHLAVLSGMDVVTLARAAGSGAVQINDRVGVVRPAHATALGKTLLCGLTREQLVSAYHGRALERYTPRTVCDADALIDQIDEIRRAGIAYDDRELDLEMRCVAARVDDEHGVVTAAIGLSAPIWRVSMDDLRKKSSFVAAAARRLSALLATSEPVVAS